MDELKIIWDNILLYLQTDGVTLAKNITIILVLYMLIKVVITNMKKAVNVNNNIEKTIPNFAISLLDIGLTVALIVYTLNSVFGVSTDSVVTIASVLTLGVSLALQDTIASLANGVIIVSSKPFVEGEYVEFNGISGTVVQVTLFNTVLKTFDGLMVTAPNTMITKNAVTNYSRLPTRRIDIDIPVGYDVDKKLLEETVMKVVSKDGNVLPEPKANFVLTSYDDNALMYSLRVWVSNGLYWDEKFDLNSKILFALKENGIRVDNTLVNIAIKSEEGGNK